MRDGWRSAPMLRVLALLACILSAAGPLSAQPDETLNLHWAYGRPASAALAPSPPTPERVIRALTAHGFTDVAVEINEVQATIRYGNTKYADEFEAVDSVLFIAFAALPAVMELDLFPTAHGVQLVAITCRRSASLRRVEACGNAVFNRSLPPTLQKRRVASDSRYRVDVILHPWVDATFDGTQPIGTRIGLAPEVRLRLAPGLTFSGQLLFTIQDDIPSGESRVRPGIIVITQRVRPKPGLFVSAAAGAFAPARHGVDIAIRAYTPKGLWSVGAELGATGRSTYTPQGWSLSPPRDWTAVVDGGWHHPATGLLLQVSAGQFLPGKRGVRVDAARIFGVSEIGFFASADGRGMNYGLTLRVPLAARHPGARAVRIRLADAYRWEYRANPTVTAGRYFRPRDRLTDMDRWIR